MQSFRCLGGDCPDTCCQHWDINLDRYHYEKLSDCLASDSKQVGRFEQYIKLHDKEHASDRNFAYIALNESGYCPFLDANELCSIHAEFGVAPLSDVCAFFPRVMSVLDDELELTGAMSCPEVVRLCLTALDAKFTDYDITKLPRQDHLPIARTITSQEGTFYQQAFKQVREVMLELATHEEFALETRLYFLANFCYRIAGNYHQLSEQQHKTLNEEIKRIRSPQIQRQLEDYFNRYENVEPVAIVVIQAILRLRIQHAQDDKLSRLANTILQSYRQQIPVSDELEVYGDNLPPDQLWQAYQANWEKLNAGLGVEFETVLMRYLVNVLQREWFVSMPDPFIYIQMLLIRISMLRFLAVSHPDILALLHADMDEEQKRNVFMEKMTNLIYLYARSIDHNHTFLNIVLQAMLEQQMLSFDYSLPFIKI